MPDELEIWRIVEAFDRQMHRIATALEAIAMHYDEHAERERRWEEEAEANKKRWDAERHADNVIAEVTPDPTQAFFETMGRFLKKQLGEDP